MSHDGALMEIRNTSLHTCRVPSRPEIAFTNAAGKPVAVQGKVPSGMHPGPVMMPLSLAPDATAQGTVRWVNGPVYDRNTCVDTTRAAITLADGTVSAELHAHICGQTGSSLEYEQDWLQPPAAGKSKQ
jgi:hypothetical protein